MRLYLDPRVLMQVADEHRDGYAAAHPFPHAVLDGVLPEEMLDTALDAFPAPDSDVWREYENYHEVKLETQGEERLGDVVSLLLYQFNSAPFLRFLERLTGIEGLIPDPYFFGGGLHQIVRGGKLGIHADFSRHSRLPLQRRLNVLVFLNRDWRDEYGGHLELWNRDMTECCVRVLPIYNRMVVFTTTDYSYHGHPDALHCPEGMSRKSIALYYYSVTRPEGETIEGKEWTLFMQRPGESLPEGTELARTDSYTGLKQDRYVRSGAGVRAKRIVRGLTPPYAIDLARRLRKTR